MHNNIYSTMEEKIISENNFENFIIENGIKARNIKINRGKFI